MYNNQYNTNKAELFLDLKTIRDNLLITIQALIAQTSETIFDDME